MAVGLQRVHPRTACPLLGCHVELQNPQGFLATDTFVVFGLGVPHWAFEQRIQLAAVFRRGHAFKTLGAFDLEVHRAAGRTGGGHGRVVGGAHDLAVHLRFKNGLDLALHVCLDQVGSKLFTNPDRTTCELEAFRVEISAGQVTLFGAFFGDVKRHFFVGVVQEHGAQVVQLAAGKVHLVVVQVEHEVGRVGLGPGTVVGQDPEAAVGHFLDARVALQRLALEGQRDACGATCRLAFHGAEGVYTLRLGEFAAALQVGWCVLGRGHIRLCGQHSVAAEGGGIGLGRGGLGQRSASANQGHQRGGKGA